MTLGDISNLVLIELQQSGAQFVTGGATAPGPNWAGVQNPQYSQGLVEFAVKRRLQEDDGRHRDARTRAHRLHVLSRPRDVHLPVPAGADRGARVPGSLAYRAHLLQSVRLALYARVPAGNRACVVGEVPARHGPGLSFAVQFGTQPTWATVDPLRQKSISIPAVREAETRSPSIIHPFPRTVL